MKQNYTVAPAPVILWQNAHHCMQMMVLGSDPEQDKRYILDHLSEPDGMGNNDSWVSAWSLVEELIHMKILTRVDLQGLLSYADNSVCLALWDNAGSLLDSDLLEKSDFEMRKDPFFAILGKRDGSWDICKGEQVLNMLEHLVDRGILNGRDLLGLFTCSSDPICFAVWKDSEWLLDAGHLESRDLEVRKERFFGLISEHCTEWEGTSAWGDEFGAWSVVAALSQKNIFVHSDFRALISGQNDDIIVALWKNARFLLRQGLLDFGDFNMSKTRFKERLLGKNGWTQEYCEESSWFSGRISAGFLIGEIVDMGLLDEGDSSFFLGLLTHETKELCLAVWENAYLLIRKGILKKEDFIRNRDYFQNTILATGLPEDYCPGRDTKLFKFLVEAGVCTIDTLYLVQVIGKDSIIRHLAEEAAKEITCEKNVDALIGKLRDDEPDIRYRSARELEEIRGDYVVNSLIPLLHDENIHARYNAAEIFKKVLLPGALFPLVRALHEENAGVRFQVCQALRANAFDFSADIGPVGRTLGILAFNEIATEMEVDELIVRVLRQDYALLRQTAERVIEKTGTYRTIDTFIHALDSGDATAFHNAASALIAIISKGALDSLARAMDDDNIRIRETAVRAAARFNAGNLAGPLIASLQDKDATVRYYAARALANVRFDGSPANLPGALIDALRDETAMVRFSAAEALGVQQISQAAGPLVKLLEDTDVIVRFFAAIALGEIRAVTAINALTQAQKDPNLIVRIAAEDALKLIDREAQKIPVAG